jgi:hypothetical protein
MKEELPFDLAKDATLRGNEYGWRVSSFPDALANAQARGFACLGGQFQFRTEDSTCEMYWLSADSAERVDEELWSDYSQRSCSEVLGKFHHLIATTDFAKEASGWPLKIDPVESLVFVAYFIIEDDLSELDAQRSS